MNILIIGAGGVTSYLLPVLLKAFEIKELTLIDKDVLEERNLDRQLFDPSRVGENKATALASLTNEALGDRGKDKIVEVMHEFFTANTEIPDNLDLIICCADNHEARKNAMIVAKSLDIPAYIAGNEYFDSQAFVFNRFNWDEDDPKNPFQKYPEILTSKVGSPISCQGDEQVAHPQLAIANFAAASKILHLMYVWEIWSQAEGLKLLMEDPQLIPTEIYGTMFATQHA
tara:strand:+ start:3543 stop:4229 length:687 start_codon:yes stop_codon:yes gene_type:complete